PMSAAAVQMQPGVTSVPAPPPGQLQGLPAGASMGNPVQTSAFVPPFLAAQAGVQQAAMPVVPAATTPPYLPPVNVPQAPPPNAPQISFPPQSYVPATNATQVYASQVNVPQGYAPQGYAPQGYAPQASIQQVSGRQPLEQQKTPLPTIQQAVAIQPAAAP